MIFSRAWFALMRRNLIYRRRNPIGLLLEIALPVTFVGTLVLLKGAAERSGGLGGTEIPAITPNETHHTFQPFSFRDYLTAMQAERVCVQDPNRQDEYFTISGRLDKGWGWTVPHVKCNSALCTQHGQDAQPFCEYAGIAVAASTADDRGGSARALDFREWLYERYPILLDRTSEKNKRLFDNFIQVFDSAEEIDRYVTSSNYGKSGRRKIAMGLVWQGNDAKRYLYTLRQNSTNVNAPETGTFFSWTTPDTQRLFKAYAKNDFDACPIGPSLGVLGLSCTGQYMYNGILTYQRLAQDYILSRTGAEDAGYGVAENGVQFVQFPTEAFTESGFYAAIEDIGPIMVMLGIIYPVASMIAFICREKELGQKELMKMMSVGEADIGWAWFVTFFLSNIPTTVATTLMSTMLYENSDVVYLFWFWFLTLLACTVFAMTVATFSSKASRGVMIGLLVFFLGIFLTLVVPIDYREDDGSYIRMISLHPVSAFSYGLQEIGRLEDQGTGVQSYTMDYTDNPSGYTFSDTISNLISSTIFWGILTWYLNRVIKPDYGQALPLMFPFQLSYWMPGRYSRASDETVSLEEAEGCNENIPVEPVSDTLKRQAEEGKSIEVKGLRKQFGDNAAVDGLTLSMYSGQITALLGHNGAGKTTTINMLTGAMAPTSGDAMVAGKDVRTQLPEIRQSLGICLQHDCLFPNLTVREHVLFFARLKGLFSKVSREEARQQIDEAIQDVALTDKSNTLSKNLSGGMKRKLSVAIAFCGGSKVVLLDEPTSGMDPFSRRFTWNVIRQYRPDRCIILTTHFMDEADILGDRIAIMAGGHLCCAGSSLFLKRTYGVGYNLTIEKSGGEFAFDNEANLASVEEEKRPDPPGGWFELCNSNGASSKEETETKYTGDENLSPVDNSGADSLSAPSEITLNEEDRDADTRDRDAAREAMVRSLAMAEGDTGDAKLQSIVLDAVEDAALLSNAGSEMSFQLPMESSSSFAAMFEKLDHLIDCGFLTSYGLSVTTIDEVFIAVAKGETGEKTSMRSASQERLTTVSESNNPRKNMRSHLELAQDQNVFFRHLGALFIKRAAFFRRDKKAWMCTTILPSVFVCIGFILFTFLSRDRSYGAITLDLGDYNSGVTVEPKNPIPFNSPENRFVCQPGQCAYPRPVVYENTTNELYFFCGYQGRFFDFSGLDISELLEMTAEELLTLASGQIYNCTISDSGTFVGRITDDGASAEPRDIETIGQASESLRASADMYAATQYAGVYFTHDSSTVVDDDESSTYGELVVRTCRSRPGNYTSRTACTSLTGIGYVIHYNYTALHVSPLYQGLADEALLREANNDDDYDIEVTIHPLPFTSVEEGVFKVEDGFASWFLIVLSFPFVGGAFASFIVKERESKAKHLQTVAGVEPAAYWLSTYLWDVLNYQIPLWVIVMLMFAFDVTVLTTNERGVFTGVLAVLVLYGPACAGFSYCVSYMFSSATMCNMFLVIFGFLIGMGGPMSVVVLLLLGNDPVERKEHLIAASEILTWVLRFTPSFCLGKAIYYVIGIDVFLLLDGDLDGTAWTEPILLYEVLFLACQSVGYLLLAIGLDVFSSNPWLMSIWKKCISIITFGWLRSPGSMRGMMALAPTEDDDVMEEQERVLSGRANDDLIVINKLTKIYDDGGKVAVNNICLGIPHGECFGLLGINGAGKTTCLAMLTAEFPPTGGDATLAGFSVTRQPQKTRRRIGYCPQYDAHFANLTGREHVVLFARIKGIPKDKVQEMAAAKLAEVGLSEKDSDRLSSGYSGGMKRRLSLACATIGQPQIVFLDECTTGVDPVARREIWKLVSDMVAGDNVSTEDRTSVVLTTHSMEECEALCPRIGIMANGRLRCLGSAQHLKNKFGQGYQLEMKLHVVDENDDDLKANTIALAATKKGIDVSSIAASDAIEIAFSLTETLAALESLSGDGTLSSLITMDNTIGYGVWKDATSEFGVPLATLAAFATGELRMRQLNEFVVEHFSNHVFRERQDTKARYEVSSEGIRISSIFATIEDHKERLRLADYGVSQTSLEQVFNLHAAEAERLKEGRID